MSEKDHIMEYTQYIPTMEWLNSIVIESPFEYNDIMKVVKEQVIKISGCTPQKYDELTNYSFDTFIFAEVDRPIIDCYWKFLESIRGSTK